MERKPLEAGAKSSAENPLTENRERQLKFVSSTDGKEPKLQVSPSANTLSLTLVQAPSESFSLKDFIPLGLGICTLIGVGLTLWHASWRMKKELSAAADRASDDRQHDREMAHKERITEGRRTAYLEVVEELVRARTFLGSFAGRDFEAFDLSAGFQGLAVATAKIDILGDMSTVLKARALSDLINSSMLKCLERAMPLAQIGSEILRHNEGYESAQLETKRILAAMRNHNESNKQDEAAFAALQRSFKIEQDRAATEAEQRESAQKARALGQIEFAEFLSEVLEPINKNVDDLISLVREELGLSTSLELLAESTKSSREILRTATTDLLNKLKKNLE